MKIGRIIPCVCSPNWEEEHYADGYYGMPQLRIYGGGDGFFDAYCPKCGRGGLLQYKSAYLALKAWNEMQTDLLEDEDLFLFEEDEPMGRTGGE